MRKNRMIPLLSIFIILIASNIVSSVSFLSNPDIDNSTQSNENVLCYWIESPDTIQANVTWYNSSAPFASESSITSPHVLNVSHTKRGEIWTCEVALSNGTDQVIQNASIEIQNSPPTDLKLYNQSNWLYLGNSTTLYEDSTYIFELRAFDYEGDNIIYTKDNSSWGSFISGVLTWTPDYDMVGTIIEFFNAKDNKVTDDEIITKTIEFTFNILPVNDTPEFSPNITDQTAIEDSLFEYNLTAEDEEMDYPLDFSIIDDGGLIGNDTLGLHIQIISDTESRLYFVPVYEDKGNHTITINLSDTYGNWRNESFNIEVLSINQIPTLAYENVSATQGGLFTMYVNSTDLDQNDTLNFSVEGIDCPNPNIWNITTLNSSANNSIGLINVTLTNDHIACRDINLSVTDSKETTSMEISLNLTNTNDAPIIYHNSTYSYNNQGNSDIHNITGYSFTELKYRINFTDPDSSTYQGENISINAIGFADFAYDLDNITGRLNFTTNKTGTFYMNINASDDEGFWTNETLVITLLPNSVPTVQSDVLTINESEQFLYSINATDAESDPLTYGIDFIEGATIFSVDSSTGLINFTPTQDHIGNYTIELSAIDNKGAIGYGILNLSIVNMNDPPILHNISLPTFVVNQTVNISIHASDKDLTLNSTQENLTYWIRWISSTTGLSSLFTVTKINDTYAKIINFTPDSTMVGDYNISIMVNDSYGSSDEYNFIMSIYNVSSDPEIINITPYGPPPTKFGWSNASLFPSKYTTINLTENMTLTFNHSTINEENETLTYSWYYEGALVSNNHSYTRYFDYNSATFDDSIKNLTLVVNDDKYGSNHFTWIMNITDINRPVVRGISNNNPGERNITGVIQMAVDTNYLTIGREDGVFYDPDDDLNLDGSLGSGESSNLIFDAHYCSGDSNALDITFEDGGITLTPLKEGTSQVRYNFSASDGYSTAYSDCVEYNIEYDPPVVVEPEVKIEYKTRTKPAYYQVEVDKIINLDILSPKAITLFENNTAKIPITIKNDGKDIIKNINLYAASENEEIEMRFEDSTIDQLVVMEEFETYLYVESYRSQGTYEIEIIANATDPKFTDKAIILVNSMQKERDEKAKNATVSKITFAMDLLTSNVECLDLNEILESIQNDIDTMDLETADAKIEEVISACRYLVSNQDIQTEKPGMVIMSMERIKNNQNIAYALSGMLLLSILGVGFSIYYTNKNED